MSAEPIISARPWIHPDQMASVASVLFTASDGMKIHGYLTLPKPDASKKPPPLVVVVHGGPHGPRDHWGFDAETQLFASQGFAVLRVNYRGSGGYGRKYQEAGYRHWGDRIMDDILDATRLVIKKGMVDSNRVCIYGGSFGGYAAMQSSIRAPELFKCAVGYDGVYDLTLMGNSGDMRLSGLARGYVRRVLGADEKALKAASPAYNADKLRARVFLIHGKDDERAPIKHAERLRDALTKLGRPPEWLVESREAHGFVNEANRERMYARMLSFINRSLNLPETFATGAPAKAN
jgi:dipeptidyl aminopeptidase/acylaminoacyl peptidase